MVATVWFQKDNSKNISQTARSSKFDDSAPGELAAACIYIYIYIYIYIIYIYIYVYVYTYTYIVYIYIHTITCVYMCIYIYTHVLIENRDVISAKLRKLQKVQLMS